MTTDQRRRTRGELRALLRARGLRATEARLAVLHRLELALEPQSHGDLVAALPAAYDRTTIFRTLATLARAQLVRRIDVGDRVGRFRRAPGGAELAATFVCSSCGTVEELAGVQLRARAAPRAIARREIDVLVRGVCDRCS